MKCVCCGNEMQKGTVSFMAVQGFGQMILSFASDENQKKSFFKRETQEKNSLFGRGNGGVLLCRLQ